MSRYDQPSGAQVRPGIVKWTIAVKCSAPDSLFVSLLVGFAVDSFMKCLRKSVTVNSIFGGRGGGRSVVTPSDVANSASSDHLEES